jgi:hypothetical protein
MKFMQKLLIALILYITFGTWLAPVGSAQTADAILLHHSVGGNLYTEGGVAAWFTTYNSTHGTNYHVSERVYPDYPYPTSTNYPYDYWNLWVHGACSSGNPGNQCLNVLTQDYDVIIFKHCYPGADIGPDSGAADITSSDRELQNYKLQFRALRATLDSYPNTKFIVWTLVPMNSGDSANTAEKAARAKQFVDWVKGEWLTEDGKSHPNIFIFDFWGYVASTTPSQGPINTLRTIYKRDGYDSHPNTLANQTIGPDFSQFIVNVIENNAPQTSAFLLWTK